MNNHFYVTLPSDSSAAYYPNNTVARFITRLPERIRLEGDYEMGLAEIIYPHTWYNVDNDDGKYWIAHQGKTYLSSGYYENGFAIAAALTREDNVKFSYNETIDRFSLSVHLAQSSDILTFEMSEDLQRYMGFDLSNMVVGSQSLGTVATQSFDVNRGLNLMYVYCDVAAHSVVGDTKTPLLRVYNVTAKHGDVVRHTYIQPHYVPVGRREFDSIEIAINNELGKPMPFQYGKSVVTLHFRRRFRL
jgi:hypothetical protein